MNFEENIVRLFKLKVISKKLKAIYRCYAYKGKTVSCLVCNWNGKQFFKDNCPRCNSLPRTRLIPYAINYFNFYGNNLRVLHVAPNKNEYKSVFKEIGGVIQYDCLDIRPMKLINLVQDLTKMTIADNTYDRAIIWHVLEHIPEDIIAISELYRVLKPGGKLLMSVPIYPISNLITYEDSNIPYIDYKKVHGHHDHYRSCGLDYYKRFEKIGFIPKILKVKNEPESDITKHGLSKSHVVWCFSKG